MFVRERENYPCYTFPKPIVSDGIKKAEFGIFHDCDMLDEAPCFIQDESIAEEYLDQHALGLLFGLKNRPTKDEDAIMTPTLQDDDSILPD